MNKINKISKFIELYDTYKNVLTDSQKETFEMYYFEDYTLQEIAEIKGISKNAVHDSVKKTETALKDLEKKIGFVKYKNEQG